MKIEELKGIKGNFEGTVLPHTNPELKTRALAHGLLTYERIDGENKTETTLEVKGVYVRRLIGDVRRFIRLEKGPKGNRDKIIGIIDK